MKQLISCIMLPMLLTACVSSSEFNPLDPIISVLSTGGQRQQIKTTSYPVAQTSETQVLQSPAISQQPTVKPSKKRYSCGRKRYCSNISSCEEAYYLLEHCGLRRLDRDRDGIPCESLCN